MIRNRLALALVAFGATVIMAACSAEEVANLSFYSLNGTLHDAQSTTNDKTMKAIVVPCKDNNTLRMYYSDSVLTLGLPDKFQTVSYGKLGHLGYRECCVESTSSSTDTWLSTGVDSIGVIVSADKRTISIDKIQMQHWTSVPLNEFGPLSAQLIIQ